MALTIDIANENNKYDVLIVGGGVAALTSAIYCQRAGLKTGFFEFNVPGGKIVNNPSIENVPSYKMVNGADLAYATFEHATKLGANYLYGKVTSIVNKQEYFLLYTEDGQIWQSDVVIIASGTVNSKLNVPGEEEYLFKGISQCAVCDGSLTRGKEVLVVGGGSSAFSESLHLSSIADKIYLIHRSENFSAEQILIDKLKAKQNVVIIPNTEVVSFKGNDNSLEQVELINNKTNEKSIMNLQHAFIYVGSKANTDFVPNDLKLDENKYIIANCGMETNINGMYAAGDCVKKSENQIITSMSDGAIASMRAVNYIEKKRNGIKG